MHQPDNPMRDIFCPIQPEVGSAIKSVYPIKVKVSYWPAKAGQ